jgi:hypothetical protein
LFSRAAHSSNYTAEFSILATVPKKNTTSIQMATETGDRSIVLQVHISRYLWLFRERSQVFSMGEHTSEKVFRSSSE